MNNSPPWLSAVLPHSGGDLGGSSRCDKGEGGILEVRVGCFRVDGWAG